MKAKMFVAALALWSAAAFALPSFNDVESAVNAGNYAQAEQMMQEVVAAKPGSAKAHYVYAEILAHDAKFDQAAREAAQAQQIDPALSFTDPNKFRDFQRLLQREQAGARGGVAAGNGYAPAEAAARLWQRTHAVAPVETGPEGHGGGINKGPTQQG